MITKKIELFSNLQYCLTAGIANLQLRNYYENFEAKKKQLERRQEGGKFIQFIGN